MIDLDYLFTDSISLTTGNNDGMTACQSFRVYKLKYDRVLAATVFRGGITKNKSKVRFKIKNSFSGELFLPITVTLKNSLEPTSLIRRDILINYVACELESIIPMESSSYHFKIGVDKSLEIQTKSYMIQPACGYPDNFSIVSLLPDKTPSSVWQLDPQSGILIVSTSDKELAGTYKIKVSNSLVNYPKTSALLPIVRTITVTLESAEKAKSQSAQEEDFNLSYEVLVGQSWQFTLPATLQSKGLEVNYQSVELGTASSFIYLNNELGLL